MILLIRIFLLGMLTGSRSMAVLSVVSQRLNDAGRGGLLGQRWVASALGLMAAGEFAGDKVADVSRTDSGPLVGRVVIGGLVGMALCGARGNVRVLGLIAGGLGAFVGTHLTHDLRYDLTHSDESLPDWLVAVGEDALVVALRSLLMPRIPSRD